MLDLLNSFLSLSESVYVYLACIRTFASTVLEKATFQSVSDINAFGFKGRRQRSGIKFHLVIKEVKVNLGSPFVQTW